MAKLTRKTQKIFADSAAASQITAFGSIKANSPNPPVYSKDPDIIQSNEFMQGWSGATQDDYAPYRQDMNAIQNLVTRQLAYLYQAGIPEYDSATQYYANCSFCQINGVIYLCIQDALNKLPTTEPTYWKEIDFSKFAPLNSPAFTGTPTAPNPASGSNDTQIATTKFVQDVASGSITGVVKTSGNQTIEGEKGFRNLVALAQEDPDEGGEIVWKGSSSSNGKDIKTDRFIDSFRVFGTDSSNNTRVLLNLNFETGTADTVTPVRTNNGTQIATTNFTHNLAANIFKYGNGVVDASLIYNGAMTGGSGQAINLPEPYTNYSAFAIVISNNSASGFDSHTLFIPVNNILREWNVATAYGREYFQLCASSGFYWNVRTNSSTTSLVWYSDNCTIHQVWGIKM